MPSRFYAFHPERKVRGGATSKTPARGGPATPTGGGGGEKTAAWPTGAVRGTGGFTPGAGFSVTKRHPVAAGLSGGTGTTSFRRRGG